MSILSSWYSPYDLSTGLDLLIVLNGVTDAEYNSGIWLCSEENNHLLQNLEGFEDSITWAVTALFTEPMVKPSAKDCDRFQPFLRDTIYALQPKVLLVLGTDALKAVWPKDELGKVQSITKAKAMDFNFLGIPVVASMNPKVHYTYLKTDGFAGDDLTKEYDRAFAKIDQLISGDYKPHLCTYFCIDDETAVNHLLSRKQAYGITRMTFDTEETVWWSRDNEKLKPHQWINILEEHGYPGDYLEERLTTYDKDTTLSWCSICWTRPDGTRETYSLNPVIITYEFLFALFYNCTVNGWNILTEMKNTFWHRKFDMADPKHKITLYDGMIRAGCKDQSSGALGLKGLAQQYVSAPAWDVDLRKCLEEARVARRIACGVAVAHIGDVNVDVARLYNAADSYYCHVLIEDYYEKNGDGGLHPECRASEWLHKSLPFFSRLETTGTLVDLDLLYSELERKEAELAMWEEKLYSHWAVQQATVWCRDGHFNFRSPIHFKALIAATYGQLLPQREMTPEEGATLKADAKKKLMQDIIRSSFQVPPWILLTEKGATSISGDAIDFYATGVLEAADGTKTNIVIDNLESRKEVWQLLKKCKDESDDLLKYYTLLNYTSSVDGRFRADYRIIKTAENESTDKLVGSVSGRTSTTPNDQNRKPELKPCDIAPPGKTKVVIDIKGAEMRVIGETTGDGLFRQWAFEGKDTHLEKASILYGYANKCSPDEFFRFRSREEAGAEVPGPSPEQKPWRMKGKTMNFAALYMEEPGTSAEKMGISEEEAIELRMRDRAMAPGIYRAQCELYNKLQRGEPAITKIFGRIRGASDWQPTDMLPDQFFSFDRRYKQMRSQKNIKLFRSVWNTWGAQADANDYVILMGIIIDWMIRSGQIPEREVSMCKFIHDSIVFDISTEVADKWIVFLARVMSNIEYLHQIGVAWSVPLDVSVTKGVRWGDEHQNPVDWRALAEEGGW